MQILLVDGEIPIHQTTVGLWMLLGKLKAICSFCNCGVTERKSMFLTGLMGSPGPQGPPGECCIPVLWHLETGEN